MTPNAKCSGCGAPLPTDAINGFCPRCLFGVMEGDPHAAELHPTQISDASGQMHASDLRALPRQFGDYELLEEIAQGGMGIVYRARQANLNRIVAVKMILAGQFATKQFIQRFRAEAGAAAALQHPNIVAIHEIGMHEGQHFFSMDYVEGQNLAQLVGNRPLPAQQTARYVKLIADAIQYAHEQGILHRDLKPSNVLIEAAFDQPRVTDFGLAKRLDSESSLTVTGQVLGSPHFIPPEQASATRGKVGRQSDVFGLGAILYYLLTARAPFQGETLETTINQVLNSDPVAPRLLNPSVSRDLETICLKCLEKEPARRYQTARELAAELERFLSDEPIRARPVSGLERAWRWCRRKPGLAASLGAALVLLLIVAIGGPVAAVRINEAHKATQRHLYAADMNLAQRALAEGDLGRTLTLLNSHRPAGKSEIRNPKSESQNTGRLSTLNSQLSTDLRGWEWRYLWRQCQGDELLTLGRHSNAAYSVRFSPDGALLATASLDRTVALWDFHKRQIAATLAHPEPVTDAVFSPDGALLATASEGRSVRLWSVAGRREIARIQAGEFLWHGALIFAPDGKTLVAPDTNNLIGIWHLETRSKLFNLAGHKNNIIALAFTPDGQTLASASLDRTVRLWDLARRAELFSLTNFRGAVYAMAVSPDSRFLAAGTAGRTEHLKLFDLRARREIGVLTGHTRYLTALEFSPDSALLASTSADHALRIWDTATLKEVSTLARSHRPSDGRGVLPGWQNSCQRRY